MTRPGIIPSKPNILDKIFDVKKPIIGVIHLLPLPGAPRYSGQLVDDIYDAAARDAEILADGGIDGIIVENAFDIPYARPENIGFETVAGLTAACARVKQSTDMPLGITCVANGVLPGIAVAKAIGGHWIRANQWAHAYISPEGLLNGPAGEALRYRSFLRASEVAVFADVRVKFGAHSITSDRSVIEIARDTEFFDADALIVTGERTGDAPNRDNISAVKDATNLPVLIGSGLHAKSVSDLLSLADGAIVGSSLKHEGVWWESVDPSRVEALMLEVEHLRNSH